MADKVRVYTATGCGACGRVKDFLVAQGVSFEELNVAEDVAARQSLKAEVGYMTTPVTVVGEQMVIGYNRAELARALQDGGA